ncbi:MAG: trigger factor [Bacteroidales bacterium]|nr:trigger factor [Bacteroidales bacterium]MCF8387347.1 trigger factor [Bacteroidales bacterium]MCF8396860.1 trigger factor [Bacteroidales bacterium]
MNITREDTGDLTSTLKVEVKQEDYREAVSKVLKDYQKKANMPGFRPGKVPMGIVKKMYGKSVIADEVNKLLSEKIDQYIKENKIELLGHPLANTEKTPTIDFEHEKDFDFYFDIGLAPAVNLENLEKTKVDYFKIKADDKSLEKQLEDIRKRFGDHIHPEEVEEDDVVKGKIEQLDQDGNPLEDGISNETSIYVSYVKKKSDRKKFIGLKKGGSVAFNPLKAMENETEVSSMLGIKKEEVQKGDGDFRFTIEEITRVKPAELNEELYKKVFPADEIKTREEFKKRLAQEMEKSYVSESDRYFMSLAMDKLMEKAKLELPREFLKRWLIDHNQGKITPEQIEEQFDSYEKSLKWQLIQNKLIQDFNVKVEEEEIKDYIRKYLQTQMPGQADDEEYNKRMDSIVESLMQNKEEIQKINDQLYDQKLNDVLKENLKLNEKSISYEDYIEKVSKTNK